jgi:hypothetical protein
MNPVLIDSGPLNPERHVEQVTSDDPVSTSYQDTPLPSWLLVRASRLTKPFMFLEPGTMDAGTLSFAFEPRIAKVKPNDKEEFTSTLVFLKKLLGYLW